MHRIDIDASDKQAVLHGRNHATKQTKHKDTKTMHIILHAAKLLLYISLLTFSSSPSFALGFKSGLESTGSGNVSNTGSIIVNGDEPPEHVNVVGINALNITGDISNSGSINATTTDLTTTLAYGILADHTGGNILNSGDISVYAASDDSTFAWGVYANELSGNILNSGSITAETMSEVTAEVWGIQAQQIYGSINNSGAILVSATGADGEALARGIHSDLTEGGIVNSGTISVSIEAGVGAYIYGAIEAHRTRGQILNRGVLEATGTASDEALALGLRTLLAYAGILNTGCISASATTNTSYGDSTAYGINALLSEGDIVNQGHITASATGYATLSRGISATLTTGDIINEGTIEAEAFGTDNGQASGIFSLGSEGDIINSGTLVVTATGPNAAAYGLEATGSNGIIINSGTISVTSDDGAGFRITSGSWDLYNPGSVVASGGTRTLEVRGSGVANLMGSFRVIFAGDPESMGYLAPLLAEYSGTMNLGGATLLAQAGNDIVWNTPYPAIENDSSTVNGDFAGLTSANPNIAVAWEDADSTGENAAVVFRYAPQASAAAQALRIAKLGVMQSSNLIQQRTFSQLLASHIRQQEITLADSGQMASDSGFIVARSQKSPGQTVFIRPYLHTTNRPSDGGMGYDGSMLGIVAGYDWTSSPELTVGLYAALGTGSVGFKGTHYDANEETQNTYSLGLHASYNPSVWHFDGSAALYAVNHEYEGLTGGGLTLEEEDDYTSYGAEVEAVGGYVFTSGNWAAMPYAGLGYSWINAPSHSTEADNSAWDTSYGNIDEHILRSKMGAQVSGNLVVGETTIVPTLGLRWEYALTDNKITASQSLPGTSSIDVEDDISRSTVIGDLSVAFVKGPASLELGAMSEYNADYNSYGGWLTLKYAF